MNSEPSYDELSFDDSEIELKNTSTELDVDFAPTEQKKSRHMNKRNYLAKKKIEQLQEDRRLRELNQDFFDDWN